MPQAESFHYPPELLELLVSTIPLLSRSKKSVLLFFRGAGISENLFVDISSKLEQDKASVNKFEICRTIVSRINEKGDSHIRERRELLKRVVEFESFSNCWENDIYKAKGLVAEIRSIVNVKDSFTRMKQEKEKLETKKAEDYNNKVREIQKRSNEIESIKKSFYGLFAETNPQKRGKDLEAVLNGFFALHKISVREAFARRGNYGEGVIEQIDGVVEIDSQIYLVEMKWKKDKIGPDDIFAHLGRIYHRSGAQGIFISESGYTDAAILAAREALTGKAILVLADLGEFVDVLENDKDLNQHFKAKIKGAILDKQPFIKP
jgi:restriction system protein